MFDNLNDRDRMLVPLPLSEILARLNPALIVRRRTQRQVEVPAEIDSPFGSDGQGLVFSRAAEKAQASQQEQPVQSAISATSNSHAIPPISMAGIRNTIPAAPHPQPPGAAPLPVPS